MQQIEKLAMPAGRVLIALMFVMSGLGKIADYTGTQGYMEMMGVAGALLPLVILTEVGGGLAVILGWQTKLAALALAGFSLISAVIFHADFGDQTQMIMFLKNVSIAGGFLFLVANGAGAYALDNRRKGA